ncbi:MAG: DsrE/DsrF-like family protein [Syntrophorhabdus sp. PtaU1.Bin058]|nr:MAG: DsrE/DsrF-like family protein [Syntrophorhabdus sp. PtaU1.Bin058]
MKKVVLFAFNGEAMCFIHVLLNGLDMKKNGYDVKIVIEGAATKLIPELNAANSPLYGLFQKARDNDIIDGACRACSVKMGTINDAEAMGLALLDDMSGHPGMARYMEAGYEVITF